MKPDPVAQLRLLDRGAAQLVGEDPGSAAKNRFLVILGSERKRKPRRDVVAIARRRLPVVAQTKGQRELRLDADFVLRVSIRLIHTECGVRVASIDAKEFRRPRRKPCE